MTPPGLSTRRTAEHGARLRDVLHDGVHEGGVERVVFEREGMDIPSG